MITNRSARLMMSVSRAIEKRQVTAPLLDLQPKLCEISAPYSVDLSKSTVFLPRISNHVSYGTCLATAHVDEGADSTAVISSSQ
jgi:hypothetical protein